MQHGEEGAFALKIEKAFGYGGWAMFIFRKTLPLNPALEKTEQYVVPELSPPQRLSDMCAGCFVAIPTRKGMKKAIDKGWVTVNGEPANTGMWISGGETIALYRPEEISKPVYDLKVEVLFEDEYLAVVYKPAGISVSGNKRRTLENALAGNLKKSGAADALSRPEPVHRLDFPTSGALLIAKTQAVLVALNLMFEHRQVEKHYAAIVPGKLPPEGELKTPVDGKPAHTAWKILKTVDSHRFGTLHLVQLIPHTGRQHQLRQHMAALGCPILGDMQYAKPDATLKGKGLFLHSALLAFNHPVTAQKITVSSALPKKFKIIKES